MTVIYAASYNEERTNCLSELAGSMPLFVRNKMMSFKRRKDAQLYLLGKMLLQKGFYQFGYKHLTLEQLKYNEYNKPYSGEEIYFNISHSGNYAVCGISDHCQVGIDIEEIKPLDISGYDNYLSEMEKRQIQSADDSTRLFYDIWTRKEAVIKADGRGLSVPLSCLDVMENEVDLAESTWFLTRVNLDDRYSMHIATNEKPATEISYQLFEF